MNKVDYLIVGAGLYGATFARMMTYAGRKCIVIDKRNHIAGNCYTKQRNGIEVHEYGPHIFHTNSNLVWQFVNRFTKFNRYTHRVKADYKHKLYSMPINLNTFNDMWGITCPQIAVEKMAQIQKEHQVWENLEEWCIAEIGEELYEKLVYGYTKKQWGREPSELPAAIIQRLPIRYTFDDGYFNDAYQGVPIHGYTVMVSNMLHDVPVYLEEDYLAKRDYWDKQAKRVVYTGALDEFFDYCYDPLDWRSLRFEHKTYAVQDYQGMAQINYTHPDIPHTRKIEHKHFANHIKTKDTIVTTEYPDKWEIVKERFYPVNDTVNNARAKAYTQKIDKQKYIFGGRLGRYQYFDMHQVIASAMKRAINECRSD